MDAQARMMFCQRCDNLLYPINNAEKEMRWLCHACHNVERHDEARLVYSLQMRRELGGAGELEQLAQFALDPTVPITNKLTCGKCSQKKIAWFVNPLEQPVEDMSLFFACVNCQHVWKGTGTDNNQGRATPPPGAAA